MKWRLYKIIPSSRVQRGISNQEAPGQFLEIPRYTRDDGPAVTICILLCLIISCPIYAFSWQDLWKTKDQQAQAEMQAGHFSEAESLFETPIWRASAAYKAGNYQQAKKEFESVNNALGYYNLGNSLARLGQLEEAIKAYDKSLTLDPNNQDARDNRQLVESLLKKQQENNQKDKKDKKDKNKKDNQNKQQDQQNKNNQSDQKDKSSQDQNQQKDFSSQDKKDKEDKKENKDNKKNKDEPKEPEKDKESSKKEDKKEANQANEKQEAKSEAEQEKEQAKEQWLRLIPDDPGGLLREKFLRDYLRKQNGWDQ